MTVPVGSSVIVQNIGSHTVAVGFGADVTVDNGVNLAGGSPGGSVAFGAFGTETTLYAISATGTNKVIVAVVS